MTQPTYEVLDNGFIKRTDENGQIWIIPNDESNSDYQVYLNPQAAQPTPIVVEHLTEIVPGA